MEPSGGRTSGPSRRVRVLVVDDSKDAADSLGLILEQWGFEVRIAYAGTSALGLIGTFAPDIALLDLIMPNMDGIELARRIRACPVGRSMRLIALSGWPHDRTCGCQREADIEAHLVKPVSLERLAQLLNVSGAR